MIIDLAAIRPFLESASAHAPGADRVALEHPVGDIEIVDVLLDDVIAAKPVEHVPIADLVFHLGRRPAHRLFQVGAFGFRADGATVPVDPHVQDVADGAVMQPGDGFEVIGLVPSLQADSDLEILRLRRLGGGQHAAHPRSVDGDGFFHEHMFSLAHGFLEHHRTQPRRRGEDDDIGGRDGLLVGFHANEFMVLLDHDPLAFLDGAGDFLDGPARFVREGVANGHEFGLLAGLEGLGRGAGATAATADERDADGLSRGGGVGKTGDGKRAEQRAARDSGGFEKAPARDGRIGVGCGGILHGGE